MCSLLILGQPCVYAYKETKEWDNFSFVLYSKGPDQSHVELEANGVSVLAIKIWVKISIIFI